MAGGVADGKENGPIEFLRPGERLLAPRIPIHRVSGMLAKIRARLENESIELGTAVFRERLELRTIGKCFVVHHDPFEEESESARSCPKPSLATRPPLHYTPVRFDRRQPFGEERKDQPLQRTNLGDTEAQGQNSRNRGSILKPSS